jgi:Domain of unknown function (DUF4372)
MEGGVDLTAVVLFALLSGNEIPGGADAYWQNVVRATHGFFAVDDVWTDRGTVPWRPLRESLRCAEHFRVMAFAQLTYRESLRDIEAGLSAQASKLYHMGFRAPIRRTTLSDRRTP